MYELFQYGSVLRPIVEEIEEIIAPRHREIDKMVDYNQLKVLRSFQKHEVSDFHFAPSTGYPVSRTTRWKKWSASAGKGKDRSRITGSATRQCR
jgi:cystathionine beta-lyase family protein involved in aluminum resistance